MALTKSLLEQQTSTSTTPSDHNSFQEQPDLLCSSNSQSSGKTGADNFSQHSKQSCQHLQNPDAPLKLFLKDYEVFQDDALLENLSAFDSDSHKSPLNLAVKDSPARVTLAGVNLGACGESTQSERLETSSLLDVKHNEHFVKTVFIPYMTEVFKDQAERAKGQNEPSNAGINRLTFLQFLNLPGILGDRLFNMCCQKKDKYGHVSLFEFRKLMQKIFYSRVETKLSLIFDMYDFDSDGKITCDDIRFLLSHIPLSAKTVAF